MNIRHWNPSINTVEDMINIFSEAKLVISSRMHGIYIAGMLGVPSVGICVHQKISLASDLFNNSISIRPGFSAIELKNSVINVLNKTTSTNDSLMKEQEKVKMCYQALINWV